VVEHVLPLYPHAQVLGQAVVERNAVGKAGQAALGRDHHRAQHAGAVELAGIGMVEVPGQPGGEPLALDLDQHLVVEGRC